MRGTSTPAFTYHLRAAGIVYDGDLDDVLQLPVALKTAFRTVRRAHDDPVDKPARRQSVPIEVQLYGHKLFAALWNDCNFISSNGDATNN